MEVVVGHNIATAYKASVQLRAVFRMTLLHRLPSDGFAVCFKELKMMMGRLTSEQMASFRSLVSNDLDTLMSDDEAIGIPAEVLMSMRVIQASAYARYFAGKAERILESESLALFAHLRANPEIDVAKLASYAMW